jgi:hypothetical protein
LLGKFLKKGSSNEVEYTHTDNHQSAELILALAGLSCRKVHVVYCELIVPTEEENTVLVVLTEEWGKEKPSHIVVAGWVKKSKFKRRECHHVSLIRIVEEDEKHKLKIKVRSYLMNDFPFYKKIDIDFWQPIKAGE